MPALTALAILLTATPAFAHGTQTHAERLGWTSDPWIVTPLALAALVYASGYMRLRQQSRLGRRKLDSQAMIYATGWLSLTLALTSPLHALGEHVFTAHMIEHEIIMAISAPLIVMARPSAVLLWGLPERMRRGIGSLVKKPYFESGWGILAGGAVATLLHGAAIWVWHVPALFDAAIDDVVLHRLQHLSFFSSALLFWWAMFRRSQRGIAAWHIFLTMLHTSLLGALIALSPVVLYGAQTRFSELSGMAPLEDQQLAGFVMWVPAGIVYAVVALMMLAQWIAGSGREAVHEPLKR